MIRFFTKNRKRLLAENKFSKYVKYASGEIVLIVVGLLFAIQINNWNEDRKQQKEVKRYLTNIVVELNRDKKVFESQRDMNQFRFHSLQYLLGKTGNKLFVVDSLIQIKPYTSMIIVDSIPKGFNQEFVKKALTWSGRIVVPIMNSQTIDEMKTAGLFAQVNNQSLKRILNIYYASILEGQRYQKIKSQQTVEEWRNSLLKEGIQLVEIDDLDKLLFLLKDNKNRVGILYKLIDDVSWTLFNIDMVLRRNEELIELLEKEIGE